MRFSCGMATQSATEPCAIATGSPIRIPQPKAPTSQFFPNPLTMAPLLGPLVHVRPNRSAGRVPLLGARARLPAPCFFLYPVLCSPWGTRPRMAARARALPTLRPALPLSPSRRRSPQPNRPHSAASRLPNYHFRDDQRAASPTFDDGSGPSPRRSSPLSRLITPVGPLWIIAQVPVSVPDLAIPLALLSIATPAPLI